MSPATRRIVIPLIVTGLGLGVILAMLFGPGRGATTPSDTSDDTAAVESATNGTDGSDGTGADETEPTIDDGASDTDVTSDDVATDTTAGDDDDPAVADVEITDLRAVAPGGGLTGPTTVLGSLDPAQASLELATSRTGAGIDSIRFADQWVTARAARQAREHRATPDAVPAPDEELRYTLVETRRLRNIYRSGIDLPSLGAHSITINDATTVGLLGYSTNKAEEQVTTWSEVEPGVFRTVVRNNDGAGDPVLEITRAIRLGQTYDLTIEQRFRNLTDEPLTIKYSQYGPGSLAPDRSRYMDRRRFRFGYIPDPVNASNVVLANGDLMVEEQTAEKRWKKAVKAGLNGDLVRQSEQVTLWPEGEALKRGYGLSWFGATNRYFSLTVHPVTGVDLGPIVEEIRIEGSTGDSDLAWDQAPAPDREIFTYLISPSHTVEPGGTLSLDMGVYAGPLDPEILAEQGSIFEPLAMKGLILYQMSSFCAFCTFQWLAHLLLGILMFFDRWTLDWGISIILLVVCVRLLLHPITKRTQVNIQRFSKQMSALKPELDKLQSKYGSDAKRMQQEQLRLFREHQVNPVAGALGCLPMFLQTPIWIALYAMLYFAFPIRQEPAFWGLFQEIGGWSFLADLSTGDHFLGEFASPKKLWMWNLTGINILPILMGLLFYFQQKYMSPPPSPNMSEEQLQQQKIIRILMPLMMPLMLYSAPSGLTLYILTSSTIGILESRWIRNHIKDLDEGVIKKRTAKPKPKAKDAKARAYQKALERAQEKRREKMRGPTKKYKKRK